MKTSTAEPQLRMRDLVNETGVPRKTIHFWIAEGLLPRALKTGRNAALYGPEHVERIRRIREMQQHHFLPLKAIAAVLGDESARNEIVREFTPEQCALVERVRDRMERAWSRPGSRRLRDILAEYDLDPAEAEAIVDLGIMDVEEVNGEIEVSAEDARLAEAWAKLLALGLTRERGFTVYDVENIQKAVELLFQQEARLVLERLGDVEPNELAGILEHAVPIANEVFAILHEKRVRQFFREFQRMRATQEEND